jgi:RNA polymerase sigma-70 factor (ECF subfamily)
MGNGFGPGRSEQEDVLGAEWERHRPAVFGAAYRLLGSVADAEDVTQDVWLRAAGADLQDIGDLRAWLVTVAARRSYDILKSARFRRETYVGPWLPEPLLTGPDASQSVLIDESVSTAMLLIMEELRPPERVAFVLHDVFGLEFGRIAEVLDLSVPGARQLASRARRLVAEAKHSTPQASKAERERVLTVFRAAYLAGDLAALVRLLHPDVVYVTDGGGKVFAMRKLIHGGERDPFVVAVDLLSQAEHGPDSPAVLVTPSETLGRRVIELIDALLPGMPTADFAGPAWRDHGEVVVVDDLAAAWKLADQYAAEHVEVLTENPRAALAAMRNYGALFLGDGTCVSYGDKVIGTNHVLPTRGAANYTGGLWVGKYLKTVTYQEVTDPAASARLGELCGRAARVEFFEGHARSGDVRASKYAGAPLPWAPAGA